MGYTLYLPAGVEDAVRRAMSRSARRNTANVERALWIASEIAKRSQLTWLVRNGFAPTSYDYLERGCPRRQISGYLTTLRTAGVIERDHYYLPAVLDPKREGKSYGYRLAEPYRDRKLVRRRGESLAVAESLQANFNRREQVRQDHPLPSPYRELDRMAKLIRLLPNPAGPDTADDMMEPMNRWGLVDPFGERFHETYQAIPRVFRHRLRIGGAEEPPFVLDIGSSQPLILTWYVTDEARRRERGRKAHGGGRAAEQKQGGGAGQARDHNEWPDFDMLLNDVSEIQRLCVEGDLYSALIGDLMRLWPADDDDHYRHVVDREKAKSAFMIFAMASARVIRESRAGRAIRKKWPHFWAAVYCIARDNELKHIARMLQRKEAELVLLGASDRILKEQPKLTFGTVHDAIICDERHTTYVQKCIEEAYYRGIGVVPRVRVEPYGKVG